MPVLRVAHTADRAGQTRRMQRGHHWTKQALPEEDRVEIWIEVAKKLQRAGGRRIRQESHSQAVEINSLKRDYELSNAITGNSEIEQGVAQLPYSRARGRRADPTMEQVADDRHWRWSSWEDYLCPYLCWIR